MSKTKVRGIKFTVILRKDDVGGYSVRCIELPGAISEGDTKKEALKNIKEAIELYLETWPDEHKRLRKKREVVKITV
ncbi:MAG: putative RNase H-like HicB family nuclease [Candidatus Nitrosomirales archaeon]|jgi:predicted RNase H-like HicB family nuclease